MSRRKKLITITALVLTGVGIVIFLIRQFTAEALHEGKPVSYWVDRACDDTEEARPFRDEVRQIGAAAVPRLKRQLQALDRWRRPYRWLQTHLADYWPEWLPNVPSAQAVRYGATETLKMLGPDAKQAVPDLIGLLPDSRGSSHYALAPLQSIGPDAKAALPVLHSMLTNKDISLRVDIAWALWSIGHETNTVPPLLAGRQISEALQPFQLHWRVSQCTLKALNPRLGYSGGEKVPALRLGVGLGADL